MAKIVVDNAEITILEINEKDYISLTDMVRNIDNGLALIEKWLRNKNTIEFLGIWEGMYNPNFNSPEFEGIKNMAGLHSRLCLYQPAHLFVEHGKSQCCFHQ